MDEEDDEDEDEEDDEEEDDLQGNHIARMMPIGAALGSDM